jgi:ribosome-binding protein aMBF1 (putative translation factor)
MSNELPTVKCPPCKGTGRIPNRKAIGKTIQARRTKAGMSLKALGAKLGIDASVLCRFENGEVNWPTTRILKALKETQ